MIVTSSPWPGSERSEIFPPFFSSRSFVTPRPIPRPGTPDADGGRAPPGERERVLLLLRRHPGARVADHDERVLRDDARPHAHLPARRRVLDRVVEHVAERALERDGIGGDGNLRALGDELEAQPARRGRAGTTRRASRERARDRSEGRAERRARPVTDAGDADAGARGGMPARDSMSVISRARPARCASEGSSPRRAASATRSLYTRRTVSGDFRS